MQKCGIPNAGASKGVPRLDRRLRQRRPLPQPEYLYGDLHVPLQAAILLSRPGEGFTGGEFALTEQRPRMQSRAEVVALHGDEAVVFATNQRPMAGTRGTYPVAMRHGVSRLRSGRRHAPGIIFHDAR